MLKHQLIEIYSDHKQVLMGVFAIDVDVFELAPSARVCYASIKPVAVVSCQNGVYQAMDMQARSIATSELCQQIPELHQYLF